MRNFSELRTPDGVQRWALGWLARSARPIAATRQVVCVDMGNVLLDF